MRLIYNQWQKLITLTAVTTKDSLQADGESTTKLTITVLDKDGDALTDQTLEIEVENGTVSVRRRFQGDTGSVQFDKLKSDLKREIKNRSMTHK